jgi:para-aminobenzoate synthetase component 1
MRINLSTQNITSIKQKTLLWANAQSEVLCYLDSNSYKEDRFTKYECLVAVGVEQELQVDVAGRAFEQLKEIASQSQKWWFGHMNYDLKNEVEHFETQKNDLLEFPELYFFVPTYLCLFHKDSSLEILSEKELPSSIWESIQKVTLPTEKETKAIALQQRISKEDYLDSIKKVKNHIVDGDTYELNFCQEFFATEVDLNPLELFFRMNEIAKAPFSAYYKRAEQYLLCGSPERFMCKRGSKVISQPIKGTIKRGRTEEEDFNLKTELRNSIKDQAENVMIVDLVRNDLTKTCQTGTIKVEELFGIYGFEKVFQMISTVEGELQLGKDWVDVIREAFPMGSMTGAPKVISMQLIEEYEQSKRGLYSGTIGYVSPTTDFDFNVVIRSMLYNAKNNYLSFQVGGAIVYDSEPMAEYEECLLKAKTMLEALS